MKKKDSANDIFLLFFISLRMCFTKLHFEQMKVVDKRCG